MHIIVKKPIDINGIIYDIGDEITNISKQALIKLNEKGYIEPLTIKDIQNFGKEEKKPKFMDKKNEKEE